MPWSLKPKKDAEDGDMRWGAVNKLRSSDFRIGKPSIAEAVLPIVKQWGVSRGTETS